MFSGRGDLVVVAVAAADRVREDGRGWQAHPGLFQIWVSDVEELVTRAVGSGAVVVTPPTPFYGSLTLARIQDPWRNLWWVYQPVPGQPDPKPAWEGGSDIIFRTLDEHLRSAR